jgi:hypothetical protein
MDLFYRKWAKELKFGADAGANFIEAPVPSALGYQSRQVMDTGYHRFIGDTRASELGLNNAAKAAKHGWSSPCDAIDLLLRTATGVYGILCHDRWRRILWRA